MNNPAISVIMCARNAKRTIIPAIRSILWQTKSDFEFLILDDGSTDETINEIQSVSDPRIQVFRQPQSFGLARGLNFLLEKARAPLIARMDADDLSYPNRFMQQWQFLQANPEIDLLASSVLVFGKGYRALCRFPVINLHEDMLTRREHGFFMPHPTWMGRTQWFLKNMYDPNLLRAQDQDLLQRSCLHSRFHCLSEPLLAYSQTDVTLKRRLLGRFNILQTLKRQNSVPAMVRPVFVQMSKGLVDALFIGVGQGEFLLKRWGQPLRTTDQEQFREVLMKLGLT